MSGLDSATKSTIDGQSKDDQEEIDERYRVAEYYCMLSTAIAGGVESPLQFIFQVVDKTTWHLSCVGFLVIYPSNASYLKVYNFPF